MPRKIAIVGCADSKHEAPWTDSEWEMWGVNNMFHGMPNVFELSKQNRLKWFELHNVFHNGKQWFRRGESIFRGQKCDEYIADLNKLNCPVYMQKKWEEIPQSIEYPLQEIVNRFGNYLTNTISYEIALALLDSDVTEIGIWGVDMAVYSENFLGNEYSWQRPSVEYFMGLARGMGIKVFSPPTSDLLRSRFLYAYQEPQKREFDFKLEQFAKTIQQKQAAAENDEKTAFAKKHQYIGASHAVREIKRVWE